MRPFGAPARNTGRVSRGPIVLSRPDLAGEASVDPFQLWQPVANAPGEYRCAGCGETKTGERYVALEARGSFDPGAIRAGKGLAYAISRVQNRILCPGCRWAKPAPKETPKRRKTELD